MLASIRAVICLPVLAMIALLGSGLSPAHADSAIRLHNYLLPDRLDDEYELGYNKLMNAIFGQMGETPGLYFAPLLRNAQNFGNDPGSCILPSSVFAITASPHFDIDANRLIESLPIDYVSVYIYTRKDQAKIHTREELKDKTLGHMIGSIAKAFIGDDAAALHAAPTEPQLIQMLDRGRVDAIMAFHPDLPIALDRLGHEGLHYALDLLIFRTSIHFVCYDTPETRRFIDKVNAAMRALRAEGSLRRFLGPHAQIVPLLREPAGSKSLN